MRIPPASHILRSRSVVARRGLFLKLAISTLMALVAIPGVRLMSVSTATRQIQIHTTSGAVLHSLFEGLAPNPKFVGVGSQLIPSRRSCGKVAGPITRVTDFLGITVTVYAQSDCTGGTCSGCYTTRGFQDCSGYCTDSFSYPISLDGPKDRGWDYNGVESCPISGGCEPNCCNTTACDIGFCDDTGLCG